MKYFVQWLESALNELAAAWNAADSRLRAMITKASNEIDERLSNDPFNEGESRPGGRRIMFAPPLSVTFQIEDDGKTITVLQVRLFRTRQH